MPTNHKKQLAQSIQTFTMQTMKGHMMYPRVQVIGGKNPEILLTHLAIRGGWKIEPANRDLYRISKGSDIIIVHAPAIRAGYQITMIYSNKITEKHRVSYYIIPENFSREDVADALGHMFELALPVPA